jgi:hypothetical protein
MISHNFLGVDITQLLLLITVSIFVLLTLIKFLRKSGKDFLKGENLEVIMAFFFTFLSITGLVPPTLILPFTLALLAVLSVSILKNRNILEKIERNSSIDRSIFAEAFDKEEVDRNIEHAKEIIFLGTNLGNVTRGQYSRIEESLKKGNKVKILIIEANSSLCDIVAKRHYEPTKGEEILKELSISLGRCKNLFLKSKETKGRLEIRFLDFLPPFGGIFIDPEDINGIIYMWFYTYKIRNQTKPKVILHAMDGQWYQLFKEEIFALWENAREYRCNENEQVI